MFGIFKFSVVANLYTLFVRKACRLYSPSIDSVFFLYKFSTFSAVAHQSVLIVYSLYICIFPLVHNNIYMHNFNIFWFSSVSAH